MRVVRDPRVPFVRVAQDLIPVAEDFVRVAEHFARVAEHLVRVAEQLARVPKDFDTGAIGLQPRLMRLSSASHISATL